MVLNALERIRQTRGVEININLELTKKRKKMTMVAFFYRAVAGAMFYNSKEHSVASSSAERLPEDRGSYVFAVFLACYDDGSFFL